MAEGDGVRVRIPAGLRDATRGESVVVVPAGTVRSALGEVDARHPGFAARVLDVSGLRRGLSVYLDGVEIRLGSGLDTPADDGAMLAILPAAGLGPTTPA